MNEVRRLNVLDHQNRRLEKLVQEQEQIISNKCKRVSQLQADIQNLLRKNAELKQKLKAKDVIINRQVIQLEKLRPAR